MDWPGKTWTTQRQGGGRYFAVLLLVSMRGPQLSSRERQQLRKIYQEIEVQLSKKNKEKGLRNTAQSREQRKKRPIKKDGAMPQRSKKQGVAKGACPVRNVPLLLLRCSHPPTYS
ncbi:unnamed protein product [Ectocarpus sp. 12 AP-2014]